MSSRRSVEGSTPSVRATSASATVVLRQFINHPGAAVKPFPFATPENVRCGKPFHHQLSTGSGCRFHRSLVPVCRCHLGVDRLALLYKDLESGWKIVHEFDDIEAATYAVEQVQKTNSNITDPPQIGFNIVSLVKRAKFGAENLERGRARNPIRSTTPRRDAYKPRPESPFAPTFGLLPYLDENP